jgi:hypothetical protein
MLFNAEDLWGWEKSAARLLIKKILNSVPCYITMRAYLF